jgi:hypothetical protein
MGTQHPDRMLASQQPVGDFRRKGFFFPGHKSAMKSRQSLDVIFTGGIMSPNFSAHMPIHPPRL